MEKPYAAINCSDHDRLLASATLRQNVHLTIILPDGETQTISGVIEDVYSSKECEYLRMRDGPTIRLDAIRALDGHLLVGQS